METQNQQLLSQVPDYIAVGGLLKATPQEDNGRRLLYFEASNEDVDLQNEVILQKALSESADYYLRHGNIDLSHYSILGAKSGVSNFMEYEIGKPIEVQVNGSKTFVKAELYTGDSPMAKNANMVWESLTKQNPPSRWYPSVGGSVLSKSIQTTPEGQKIAVVDKVRWNNVALDRCPVNSTVPEVSKVAVGVFAKSLNGFVMSKALEAGYGTDSTQLTGGAALRVQSLYQNTRNHVAKQLNSGALNPRNITPYIMKTFGLCDDDAQQFTNQFLTDLTTHSRKNNAR